MAAYSPLGSTFGGASTPGIGVVAREIGPLGEELEDINVKRYSSEGDLVDAVERGRVEAGLVIPKGYDAALRDGDNIVLRLFVRPGSFAQRATVEAAVGEQGALIRSARFAQSEGVASLDDALERAAQAVAGVSGVRVRTTGVGEPSSSADLGKFDEGTSTQLLLFIFMTSLPGGSVLNNDQQAQPGCFADRPRACSLGREHGPPGSLSRHDADDRPRHSSCLGERCLLRPCRTGR